MELNKIGVGFGVMIIRDNKIILGQRHFDPAKADSELHGEGTWTMPGGKLHFGETFEEGALREVFEETGIQLSLEDVKVISVSNDKVTDAHFVTIGLLCTKCPNEPKVMEPDEITQWGWFDLNKLPEPLFEPSRKIIDSYKGNIFYIRD